MAVSKYFKLYFSLALGLTVLPKLLFTSGISNPAYAEVVRALSPFFTAEGFEVASPVQFAGKEALLAMKDECLMRIIPVAHQGWHQETIRQSVSPPQQLWFQFEGKLTEGEQETFYPMGVYYVKKAVRHLGATTYYPPMLAIVADGPCSMSSIHWGNLPTIPFKSAGWAY